MTARARTFIGDVCGGGDVARGALSFGCAYGDVYVKSLINNLLKTKN